VPDVGCPQRGACQVEGVAVDPATGHHDDLPGVRTVRIADDARQVGVARRHRHVQRVGSFPLTQGCPESVRVGPDVVAATATGADGAAGLGGGEALGSAAGLAPAQPASTRTAPNVLAAIKGFTEDRRAAGGVGSQPPAAPCSA
jgi:hypothetical protein